MYCKLPILYSKSLQIQVILKLCTTVYFMGFSLVNFVVLLYTLMYSLILLCSFVHYFLLHFNVLCEL